MFTDMVGYTALGQRNESLSLALVEEQKKLVRPILARHSGREVKTIGDSFMVEFPNAVDSVRCAYDIQRATREFNLSLASDRRIHLRIGIHVGEVVESDGDISGDAVNIAARIEPLADDGGICLTRQVYDHVKNKVDLQMVNLGPKPLKNVSEPTEVYKIAMPWETGLPSSTPQLDPKRLAVMPFVNMSTDPNDAYFADGLTEELISTISSIRYLTVISRTSVMKYKGGSATAGEIGQALKVGSIIEGSVRKSANRARISAQLIDVNTDGHLWSRTYDREMHDIFEIQSEIAQQVADALKVQLPASERKEVERRATGSTEAHMMYLKGRYYWNERTREAVTKAIRYFEEAIRLDRTYALAFSGLADCYTILADWYWMDPNEAFPKARDYDEEALSIDPKLAEAHASLGIIYNSFDGKWSESEDEFKLAIDLKPGLMYAHMWYGLLLEVLGRQREAFEQMELAANLDPLSRIVQGNLVSMLVARSRPQEAIELGKRLLNEYPDYGHVHESLGWAYYLDSRPTDAVKEIRQATALTNNDPWMKSSLACVLGLTGQREEATKLLDELNEDAKTATVSKTQMAQILFALGRNDEAFIYLDKAYADRSIFVNHASDLGSLRFLPWFSSARSDYRWLAFEGRLGFKGAQIKDGSSTTV